MSVCKSVMPSKTNRKTGSLGFKTIHANANIHHVQRQMRKKYVGVWRRRRMVVWGMAVMRNFGFWLIAFASRRLPYLFYFLLPVCPVLMSLSMIDERMIVDMI